MKNLNRRNFISQLSRAVFLAGTVPTMLSGCASQAAEKKRGFKLGACDWSMGKGCAGSVKAFDVCKEVGLDGVQISQPFKKNNPVFCPPEKLAEYKAAMARTGKACASTAPMLNSDPFYSSENTVPYVCSSIETAADLGADTILLPFYGKANMSGKDKRIRGELFAPLVSRLKEVAKVAEKRGVLVCLENSLNAEDNIRIIEAVGSDNVKVYFDIFNFQYYGFETVPEMKKLKGYIGQIHLKDKGHKLDSNSGCPRNMQQCFDTIREIGYEGWLVFEFHGLKPERDGSEADVLRHNIEFVKKSSLFS